MVTAILQRIIIDFLINQRACTLHNAPMDNNDQYNYEILYDSAFLQYSKGRFSVIFVIPDDVEQVHEYKQKDDNVKYRIRVRAILAHNSYSGNWQEVCCAEQSNEHVLIRAKTTFTKSDRKIQAMTSHEILDANWSKSTCECPYLDIT